MMRKNLFQYQSHWSNLVLSSSHRWVISCLLSVLSKFTRMSDELWAFIVPLLPPMPKKGSVDRMTGRLSMPYSTSSRPGCRGTIFRKSMVMTRRRGDVSRDGEEERVWKRI